MINEIVNININDIVPYVNNARTHSDEQILQIRASLREFGFVSPILVDRNYGLIAGHGRLMAAKLENYKTVPCVIIDGLTDAQKKAYILADNRLAEKAGWNMELVNIELQELMDMDFNIELTGFEEIEEITDDDLDALMEDEVQNRTKEKHRVIVDCQNENQTHELENLLQSNGYKPKVENKQ